ncbi:glycosyltransferase family 39 protein [Gloeothece verrucosa]|uniref:Glycosyltransferase RgtA/B/C/D-like domain-containing protein n=1 Tax=Gloeothece verrucosa (strain PCC 7822) TaxID=497965 RepID=E0UJY5_GLOV7|nr:glycosyltransferase family 39 protein [Gloeothece verrucosa]ADN14621.1 conserved hypothetical protein [Gloeothece verrucosa PCC 7822]
MTNKLDHKFWNYGLILIILTLGIFFRFVNLDKKVYWHDEVYTKLHIAGYTYNEWQPVLFNGQIQSIENLQKYQRLTPQKGLYDTLKSLAIDDPHHPPFYYIICRFWVQQFGNSITTIRSLSACLSLLALPAIYWLCLELFSSQSVGEVAVCLLAISPLFVLYAQEAREYSLLIVIILVSSGAFLRAIRLTSSTSHTILSWGLYTLTLIMGLYTSLTTLLLILIQGLYLLIREPIRLTQTGISYLISVIASGLIFLPWIIVLITNYEKYQSANLWMKFIKIPSRLLFEFLGLNISRIFVDLGGEFENPLIWVVMGIILIVVGWGLWILYRTTSVKIWGFIFTLISVPILSLLLPDLLWGGVRSLSSRYLFFSWLGILLTVAYLLTTLAHQKRKIWPVMATIVFSAGIISCAVNAQSNTSWMKVISYSLPQVANIINQSSNPLLVGNQSSYNPGNLIALSYLLKPEAKFQLLSDEKTYIIPKGYRNIFLLSPSEQLSEKLEKSAGVKLEFVLGDNHLWLWKVKFLGLTPFK